MQLRCSLCEAPQKVGGGTNFCQIYQRLLTDYSQILHPTSRQVTDFGHM